MIAQVSAIQPTMNKLRHTSCDLATLPEHLQELLRRTSGDLDSAQKNQLASTLLEFVDLFPIPGSALTGHTDAVEHNIDTGDLSGELRGACPPRRLNGRRSALRRCCPVDKSSRARVRGQHRWYW